MNASAGCRRKMKTFQKHFTFTNIKLATHIIHKLAEPKQFHDQKQTYPPQTKLLQASNVRNSYSEYCILPSALQVSSLLATLGWLALRPSSATPPSSRPQPHAASCLSCISAIAPDLQNQGWQKYPLKRILARINNNGDRDEDGDGDGDRFSPHGGEGCLHLANGGGGGG